MDTTKSVSAAPSKFTLPLWASALIPLLILAALVAAFFYTNPLALFRAEGLPPIESLSLERVELRPGQFVVSVFNGSPDPITIAQVTVDDAYWQWDITPSATLPRFGRAIDRKSVV